MRKESEKHTQNIPSRCRVCGAQLSRYNNDASGLCGSCQRKQAQQPALREQADAPPRARELWTVSWSRPLAVIAGVASSFTVDAAANVIMPPPEGGLREVQVKGKPALLAIEQWNWEPYDLADANRQLAEGESARRQRYNSERLGLYIAFSRLPVLGEGKTRAAVAAAYCNWCNRWGSPGLLSFLFTPAGHRDGEWFVREKRNGALLTETEFFARYPEAELGDRRYREPVRVADLSREIALFRHVLLLCTQLSGDDVAEDEAALARAALLAELRGGENNSPQQPDYQQGLYVRDADRLLWRWLWVHARGGTLSFTYDLKATTYETVWAFDSFLDGLYHLLLEDITAGQLLRRCADPKCRLLFRPKRDGVYHDEKCRRRVAMEEDKRKAKRGLALAAGGASPVAIAKEFGWSLERTQRRLEQERLQQQHRDHKRKAVQGAPPSQQGEVS